MKTKIFELNSLKEKQKKKAIGAAAKAVLDGGVIVYPTESSYALGVDATNPRAVKKVFKLKGRKGKKALPIIVSNLRMAGKYALLNWGARKLVREFMPGPLTIVVEKKRGTLPDSLSPRGIAFRIPGSTIARAICGEAGKPITATSANKAGEPSIFGSVEVVEKFSGRVELIISAGKLPKRLASTIVDFRRARPKLVRRGPIALSAISAELNREKT